MINKHFPPDYILEKILDRIYLTYTFPTNQIISISYSNVPILLCGHDDILLNLT